MTNDKGGVGKTTSCVLLGCALSKRGSVGLLDGDPQGSATAWAMAAEDAGTPLPFTTTPINMRMMEREAAKYDFALYDTPPGNTAMIAASIEAADVVLIPTETSPMDIQRVWPTCDAAAEAGKPCGVLLTKTRSRTTSLARALQGLRDGGVRVFESTIPLREEIKTAYGTLPGKLFGYEDVAAELEAMLRG